MLTWHTLCELQAVGVITSPTQGITKSKMADHTNNTSSKTLNPTTLILNSDMQL